MGRLASASVGDDYFIVRIVAKDVAFHQADQNRTLQMNLVIQVALLALDEEGLQASAARKLA
jgi:hypothetical protein